MTKATPSNGVSRDSNGVYSKSETRKFEGTDKSGDSAIQSITMLAIGFVGMRLMSYKKWTPDMMVVAAASAAYIMAQIANILSLKKQIKDMEVQITKRSDGKIDQAQIETLQKLKESYEATKKSLKTTKTLQMAAAAIFAAATATAAYQRLTEEGQKTSCEFAITNTVTELGTCAASTTLAVTEATSCSLCAAQLTDFGAGIATTSPGDALPPMPTTSMTKAMADLPKDTKLATQANMVCTGAMANTIKMKSIPQACSTYLTNKKGNRAYTEVAGMSSNQHRFLKSIIAKSTFPLERIIADSKDEGRIRNGLKKALDFLFPKAEAGWMPWLGLGAGAAAALAAAQFTNMKYVDQVIYSPGGRIIAWGVMTGAALMAASSTQGEIDKTEENIKKIDQILKEMNALQNGVKLNTIQEQAIKMATVDPNSFQDLQLSTNPAVKTDCITGSGNSNCASLYDQVKNMPNFAGLPDSFKNIASQSANLANGLTGTGTISGATLSSAASLAGKQNAISTTASKIKNKLNEDLAKAGKAKIDFDGLQNKMWKQLKSGTEDAIKAKGFSGSSLLASTNISPVNGTNKAHDLSLAAKKSGVASIAGGSGGQGKEKEKALQFDFQEESLAAVAAAANGIATSEERYDTEENEISKNKNESIFQIISNRYFRSAFPKLLEEVPTNN